MLPQGKIEVLAPCQRKGKGVGVRRAEQFMSTPEVLPPPQQGATFRSGLRPRKWFRVWVKEPTVLRCTSCLSTPTLCSSDRCPLLPLLSPPPAQGPGTGPARKSIEIQMWLSAALLWLQNQPDCRLGPLPSPPPQSAPRGIGVVQEALAAANPRRKQCQVVSRNRN